MPRYNMPSFKDLLAGIANTWQKQPEEAERVSNEVYDHLQQSLSVSTQSDSNFTPAHLDAVVKSLIESYDWGYGGLGFGRKFSPTETNEFFLVRAVIHALQTDTIMKKYHHLVSDVVSEAESVMCVGVLHRI